MSLSEHLSALGGEISSGESLLEVLTAKRLNAILGCLKALAAGEGLITGPNMLIRRTPNGSTLTSISGRGGNQEAGSIINISFVPPVGPITPKEIAQALVTFYTQTTAPPLSGNDLIQLYSSDETLVDDKLSVLRGRIYLTQEEPPEFAGLIVPFTIPAVAPLPAQNWFALVDLIRVSKVKSLVVEIPDGAMTGAAAKAAIVAFYGITTAPQEFDVFDLRGTGGRTELRLTLTQEAQKKDRWDSNVATIIQGREWYFMAQDTSGRVYYEDINTKIKMDETGLEMLRKINTKTIKAKIEDITEDMTIQNINVVVGNEVRVSRILASEPLSQTPPVLLPSLTTFKEGGAIKFEKSNNGELTYICVNPNQIFPSIYNKDWLIRLDHLYNVNVGTDKSDGNVYLILRANLDDNADSDVRLFVTPGEVRGDDDRPQYHYDLSQEMKDRIAALETKIVGATIACDETGVTLTWGT